MAKRKYQNENVIYFVSKDEHTLPSRDTILEEIEKCIPYKYDIVSHQACYSRPFLDRYYINYFVEKDTNNRYKITLYYTFELGILGYALMMGGLIIGGSIGYHFFKGIGAFVGAIVGAGVVGAIGDKTKDVEEVCDRIVQGIKEYERAHLLNISAH